MTGLLKPVLFTGVMKDYAFGILTLTALNRFCILAVDIVLALPSVDDLVALCTLIFILGGFWCSFLAELGIIIVYFLN